MGRNQISYINKITCISLFHIKLPKKSTCFLDPSSTKIQIYIGSQRSKEKSLKKKKNRIHTPKVENVWLGFTKSSRSQQKPPIWIQNPNPHEVFRSAEIARDSINRERERERRESNGALPSSSKASKGFESSEEEKRMRTAWQCRRMGKLVGG